MVVGSAPLWLREILASYARAHTPTSTARHTSPAVRGPALSQRLILGLGARSRAASAPAPAAASSSGRDASTQRHDTRHANATQPRLERTPQLARRIIATIASLVEPSSWRRPEHLGAWETRPPTAVAAARTVMARSGVVQAAATAATTVSHSPRQHQCQAVDWPRDGAT